MRFGVIVPDRGDRPEMMKNCMRLIEYQSVKPETVLVVDFAAESESKDITKRYRTGYNQLSNKGLDVLFFIENDDWYRHDYFEKMLAAWQLKGCPDIFGTKYTIYYHIGVKAWFTMNHVIRSSAMSTMIKPDLEITWPVDEDPYTDIHLWQTIQNRLVFDPNEHLCIGIKHGTGLCGGVNHRTEMQRYVNLDKDAALLKEWLDSDSFNFYMKYANEKIHSSSR